MLRKILRPSLFTLTLLTLTCVSTLNYSWSGWQPSLCWPDKCFCEAIRPGIIRQPANTWSSLAFVWVGLLVMFPATHPAGNNPLTREKTYRWIYGAALILIGMGSAFLHASLTFVGQFFDVSGMNLLASFVLLYNLHRLRPFSAKIFLTAYVALNAILAWLLIEQASLRRWLFAGVLLAGLILLLFKRSEKGRTETRWLLYGLMAQLTAFIIWTLDIKGILCAPHSLMQGHAIWHLLGAVAAFFLYRFYSSESFVITAER
jgi:dihydroceramidase